MAFKFQRAQREGVGLLIGLAGGTGSGKTFSAMRLASGLADGKPFAVIDTEAGRAKHYADQFVFDHGDLSAPFTPEAYTKAIEAADAAKYPVIVVDSVSHVWAGDGGVLDWHEKELDRMAGEDWKKREACKMAAWVRPKMWHKKMVQKLLQLRAHVILGFRAEEKIEMRRAANGKFEVVPKSGPGGFKGWLPVCEKNLPYELTVSFLLTSEAPGVPKPIKLQEQHRVMFPLSEPLSQASGRALAKWAKGDGAADPTPASRDADGNSAPITQQQTAQLRDAVRSLKIDPAMGQNMLHLMFPSKTWPSDKLGNNMIATKHLNQAEAATLLERLKNVADGLATILESGEYRPLTDPA